MENKIILASQNGDLDKIKSIPLHSDVWNFQDEYGRTVLHYACWNGHLKIVKYLIKNKVINSNCRDNFAFAPLHLVQFEYKDYQPGFDDYYKNNYARNPEEKDFPSNVAIGEYRFKHVNIKNKLEITKLLISSGADVNSCNDFNCTPLHYVATNGDLDSLVFLLKNGASINAENIRNANPLFDAVMYDNLELVKVLVKKGADLNKITHHNSFPLFEACHRGFIDIVKYLIDKGADIEKKNNLGRSPFLEAVSGGYNGGSKRNIVQYLLKKGADINIEDKWGETPLLRAISRADYLLVEELFKRGVNIPNFENKGNLIHYFVARQNVCEAFTVIRSNDSVLAENNIIKILINKRYDINSKDQKGETPLNIAAALGKHSNANNNIVELLLINGANPNIPDNEGLTSLQKAASLNDFNTIKRLISNGAKLTTDNKFTKSPFQLSTDLKIKLYLFFKMLFST